MIASSREPITPVSPAVPDDTPSSSVLRVYDRIEIIVIFQCRHAAGLTIREQLVDRLVLKPRALCELWLQNSHERIPPGYISKARCCRKHQHLPKSVRKLGDRLNGLARHRLWFIDNDEIKDLAIDLEEPCSFLVPDSEIAGADESYRRKVCLVEIRRADQGGHDMPFCPALILPL